MLMQGVSVKIPYTLLHKDKLKKVILKTFALSLGILGLALFRWTPVTGKGFAIYGVLLVLLIAAVIVLAPKHERYWPDPPK